MVLAEEVPSAFPLSPVDILTAPRHIGRDFVSSNAMDFRQQAHDLVPGVVLGQNNVFIKELLRKKNYTGAANKGQIEQQLHDAIDANELTYEDLTAWIDETEGWGNEHVYLYKVPDSLAVSLGKPDYVRSRLEKNALADLWHADRSLEFPETRKLTGVYHADGQLTFVWHEGAGYRRRASEKDFERDEPDGEHYFYQAYRRVPQRDVTRVIVSRTLLAVLLPGDYPPAMHMETRAELSEQIGALTPFAGWEIYSMGEAIKALDTASMKPKISERLRAPSTRWIAKGGGHVDFSSDTDGSYAAVDELREVRSAVRRSKFKGGHGQFFFRLAAADGKERETKVHLYSDYDRIRFTARLTRSDVWWILKKIPKRRK